MTKCKPERKICKLRYGILGHIAHGFSLTFTKMSRGYSFYETLENLDLVKLKPSIDVFKINDMTVYLSNLGLI